MDLLVRRSMRLAFRTCKVPRQLLAAQLLLACCGSLVSRLAGGGAGLSIGLLGDSSGLTKSAEHPSSLARRACPSQAATGLGLEKWPLCVIELPSSSPEI